MTAAIETKPQRGSESGEPFEDIDFSSGIRPERTAGVSTSGSLVTESEMSLVAELEEQITALVQLHLKPPQPDFGEPLVSELRLAASRLWVSADLDDLLLSGKPVDDDFLTTVSDPTARSQQMAEHAEQILTLIESISWNPSAKQAEELESVIRLAAVIRTPAPALLAGVNDLIQAEPREDHIGNQPERHYVTAGPENGPPVAESISAPLLRVRKELQSHVDGLYDGSVSPQRLMHIPDSVLDDLRSALEVIQRSSVLTPAEELALSKLLRLVELCDNKSKPARNQPVWYQRRTLRE